MAADRLRRSARLSDYGYAQAGAYFVTLAVIVRTYKAAVTTLCRQAGYADFQWQHSYYERVIRDDAELKRMRLYIIDDPANWNKDEHHPHH